MERTVRLDDEVIDIMDELVLTVRQCKEKYVSPATLRQIYRGFCRWRDQSRLTEWRINRENLHRITTFERHLVHYLLERFYWIRYGDSDTVADLLRELFALDGHLGKIFDFQQLSLAPKKRRISNASFYSLTTTWSEEVLSNEDMQPIDYFMEHANKRKVLFNGRRMTEQYFVQHIRYRREMIDLLLLPPCSKTFKFPEILVKLLQYGLFANLDAADDDVGKLLTGIMGVILSSNENCERLEYTSRIVEAGNVLLRAIPHVCLSSLLREQKLGNRRQIVWYLVHQLSVPHYLPCLKMRCTGPQKLQHLCRLTVRRILYQNWKLPQGIFLLPVPGLVREYINLQHDD